MNRKYIKSFFIVLMVSAVTFLTFRIARFIDKVDNIANDTETNNKQILAQVIEADEGIYTVEWKGQEN